MLDGLSADWSNANEGENTWSPFDVVGHLIYAEHTNWVPRVELILSDRPDKTFAAFDRFAQLKISEGKTLRQLLDEFKIVRAKNVAVLKSKQLSNADLQRTGIHPQFGEVTLRQLLATWTAHDMTHLAQIVRVMAKQYKDEVGPWAVNLKVLRQ